MGVGVVQVAAYGRGFEIPMSGDRHPLDSELITREHTKRQEEEEEEEAYNQAEHRQQDPS
jgi:hypothetical protein